MAAGTMVKGKAVYCRAIGGGAGRGGGTWRRLREGDANAQCTKIPGVWGQYEANIQRGQAME